MLLVALAASACSAAGGSSGPASETGAGDGGPYTGAVLASVDVGGASPSTPGYWVQAGFSADAVNIEFVYPETTADAGCSCTHGIGTPGPEEVSAGTITIAAASAGPVLAALMPNASNMRMVYGGTSVTGWDQGAVLGISAHGYPNQVKPFSTTLRTAAPFSGVTPALGAAPVGMSLDADFTVSWTPEAMAREIVSLSVSQVTSASVVQCTCFGPESLGAITMPASFLAEFAPSYPASSDMPSASVYVTRSVVSTSLTETALVYLIGQASLSGSATLQ